jgi:tetratricopeptide (TPR) repeat protein
VDPVAIELCEEALQLLDPEAAPIRALAVASLAWLRSFQSIPEFIDDLETATALLVDIDPGAPRVGAAVRWMIAFAGLSLPGAADRLRLCDQALAVDPEAEDPWWDQIATGLDITGELHYICRGHLLLALGRRAEFEANLAHLFELGESTGTGWFLATAHVRTALLEELDGRFGDVLTSAARAVESAPNNELFASSHFVVIARVAAEEGRFDQVIAPMEAALRSARYIPSLHAMLGRARLETGDVAGAIEVLDHLVGAWTGLARDWLWSVTLAETAEVVAGLGATEHAELMVDELEPYAGELLVGATGTACAGAADRYRGMLLGLLGRHDEGIATLVAALTLEESVGSPTFTARTRYWLARALLRRDGPGDREHATAELNRSIQTAERLGMSALVIAGRELERG